MRRCSELWSALEREMREQIAEVHQQYRRDLVLYDPKQRGADEDSMDFNKLTIKSQEAIAAAQEDARRRGNPEVYPEHLLLALLEQDAPASSFRTRRSCVAETEAKLRDRAVPPGRRPSSRAPR